MNLATGISKARSALAAWIAPSSRASKEPGVSLTSSDAERYFGIKGATASGVEVSETTALGLSTYYACIRNIADDTSKCAMLVGAYDGDGKKMLPDHDVAYLFNIAPNPETTPKIFREFLVASAVGWGNGCAEIQWRGNGRPGALWPLLPQHLSIRRVDGRLVYVYRGRTISAENVFHVPGFSFNGVTGQSIASIARESLGGAMAAEKFGQNFFGNAARPSGALGAPGPLSDKAYNRLKASLENEQGGILNAGRPLLLEEGLKWDPFAIPPNDAQFLETRGFNVPEVCRWFRMPPHKVADLSKAHFANIEHQSIEYVQDCLVGWMMRVEQEIQRKLLQNSRLFARHDLGSLLRGDMKARFESYAIGRQWGLLTTNMCLRYENLDPIGPEGDVFLVPVNMANAKTLLAPPKPAEPKPAPAAPEPGPEDPAKSDTIPSGG